MRMLSYNTRWLPLFFTWIASCTISCKKFVDIPPPKDKINTQAVFADSADAVASINGIYTDIMRFSLQLLNGGITLYTSLASDELYPSNAFPDANQFYINAISPFNNNVNATDLWSMGYQSVYKANACIEGLEKSNTISISLKKQLINEAKFIRAFCYFNLINLYGDVPLVTSTDYKVNAALPRANKDSIYLKIIEDLTEAKNSLQIPYPSNGRARPNKNVAAALLARVYLYRKLWAEAEQAASDIISQSMFFLEPDLNGVFLAGSNEAIWQMVPLEGSETAEGSAFVTTDSTVIPPYILSDNLLNEFENGDKRRISWLDSNAINGIVYYYPYKYKLGYDGSAIAIENYMVFRLAEQYLIRAEARAQQNDIPHALTDLNIVRSRAGLPNSSAIIQPDVLSAIYHERQTELFCEWGHRWFDLKRLEKLDPVMSIATPAKGGSWNTNWQWFPIPFNELQKNPFLIQNSGY